MVTNAHRVEVEVGADGHASATPSGAAASGRPDEGLCFKCHSKGHGVYHYPEVKGKGPVDTPNKQKWWWQGCSFNEMERLANGYIFVQS
jgi:hypothetical protein